MAWFCSREGRSLFKGMALYFFSWWLGNYQSFEKATVAPWHISWTALKSIRKFPNHSEMKRRDKWTIQFDWICDLDLHNFFGIVNTGPCKLIYRLDSSSKWLLLNRADSINLQITFQHSHGFSDFFHEVIPQKFDFGRNSQTIHRSAQATILSIAFDSPFVLTHIGFFQRFP